MSKCLRLCLWMLLLALSAGHAAEPEARGVEVYAAGRLGDVRLYHPSGPVRSVALFLSGDGGWNEGAAAMAEALRAQGALVAGVDVPAYRRQLEASDADCEYLGGEFEHLSQAVQAHAGLHDYHYPILVGYSSGAALAYALINQAPKGVFAGALVLGFCADLALHKPLCPANQLRTRPRAQGEGVDLLPVVALPAPWITLQGAQDQVCPAPAMQAFLAGIGQTQWQALPAVDHYFSDPAQWQAPLAQAYQQLVAGAAQNHRPPAPEEIGDLPIVEVPASATSGTQWVLLLTGDGGYAGLDQDLAAGFAASGRPTVVLNSLKYFWSARTPAQIASDLDRLIRHYQRAWQRDRLIVVGYSQGADVLPFALNRIAADTRAAIAATALIGLSSSAVFEFHFSNWLTAPDGTPTRPELDRLDPQAPLICVYGREDADSLCPALPAARYHTLGLPGGHHFNGDYQAVVDAILDWLPR